MSILVSSVDVQSEPCQTNLREMSQLLDQVKEAEAKILEADERARPKFEKRNQLTPRDRISLLLDPGAPFLELSALAGFMMHDDKDGSGAGGGSICGIGFVNGVRVLAMASNSAIKGGTISPMGLKKSLRAQEIALQNKLPVIFLVESGGANLNYQSEIFIDGGQGFANQARLSAAGIPQITVVHGSSTAGGAYFPGMSDYVVMVKKRARVFLAGPPLLKAATGEIATDEELGGAEMHAQVAGTAEYLAEDDRDAIRLARDVVRALGWNDGVTLEQASGPSPEYSSSQLMAVTPADFKTHYDVREVITRIVDASEFTEFKQHYEPYTICGHAKIDGYACGLIGNNGPITAKGAVKAAQFIQLCCQSKTPIIYLQNTTGFMVGTEAEQSGIVKHGSKMLQAVANADVPQITLVIGASFGAGNYGMCGRGLSPRFIFAWPNARVGVMGAQQAAGVMSEVTAAKMARAGKTPDPAMLESMKAQIVARMEHESSALFSTARLWDDGIIDPRDSRKLLSFLLATCREADQRGLAPNSFGVARM